MSHHSLHAEMSCAVMSCAEMSVTEMSRAEMSVTKMSRAERSQIPLTDIDNKIQALCSAICTDKERICWMMCVLCWEWKKVHGYCMREQSRAIRKIVIEEVLSAFDSMESHIDVPRKCPFHPNRDQFLAQEAHKTMESMSKWTCEFCGKAFISESYLDFHFDNRHPQHVKQEKDTVCLSDYCDLFRCDVLTAKKKADFWEVALCIEDDMVELKTKCKSVMETCIPTEISRNESNTLRGLLHAGICSYLTCHSYWEVPFINESHAGKVLYIIGSITVFFVLILYYCLMCNHFYSDDPLWDPRAEDWEDRMVPDQTWRPSSKYNPDLAAQQKSRISATRRKAQPSPNSAFREHNPG